MTNMITVAPGFQYSINIGYDLWNDDKLSRFIPTKSAFKLLEEILLSTNPSSSDRARVLIGAYGKGKSHIVLMILSNDILLSFVGFNSRCILSDWFENFDDAGYLIDKLDIVNMSLESGKAYFNDFLYMFARDYYFFKYNLMINDLIPVDLFNVNEGLYDPISRDQIDQIIHDQIFRSLLKYDTDYVPYDDDKYSETDTIDFDIDLMLLDEDEQESPFDEDRADEENDMYGDEDYQQNEYEFDDVDPEIFKDPTLMVKWLKKADNN